METTTQSMAMASLSYFCTDPSTSSVINFARPVVTPRAVWTNIDRGVSVELKAFAADSISLGKLSAGSFSDGSFFR